MKKRFTRFLSCLLVFVLVVPFFCVTSHAVLPLGFAQSVLASYVTSTGYKMWQDQAVGDSILQSLATLYSDTFLPQSGLDEVSLSQFALQSLLDANLIGMDNSGNVVVSKMAADVFQQFSDWLQTEYSVPVGDDTPTQLVAPSSGPPVLDFPSEYSVSGAGTLLGHILYRPYYKYSDGVAACCFVNNGDGWSYPVLVGTDSNTVQQVYNSYPPTDSYQFASVHSIAYNGHTLYFSFGAGYQNQPNSISTAFPIVDLRGIATISPTYMAPLFDAMRLGVTSTSVKGLAVSLANDVVDQAAKANDDDAVVIGVGAQVGATAQEIADLIAQGINARTLDPTITITAEAVIDTPVQPYPDVDGLGLPTLGAALVSRFPFCVPWDFVDTLRILDADPIPPVFDVTLVPASVASRWGVTGNYTLHVDLTSAEYAKLFAALRWGTLVGFCLGLALLTKRLIWTA